MVGETQCQFCPIVTKVAFWGRLPERSWKRPALFVGSLASTCGLAWVLWMFWDRWMPLGRQDLTLALGVVLILFPTLCLLVSVRGCNSCVARLMGDL
jgi:hypothetical protein